MDAWKTFVEVACEIYTVDPAFFLALCQIESGLLNGPEIRFGRLGKTSFYGPGGLNRECECLKGLDLNNPYVATWAAIRAIKGTGRSIQRQKRRLKTYNSAWTPAYEREVMRLYRQLKRN